MVLRKLSGNTSKIILVIDGFLKLHCDIWDCFMRAEEHEEKYVYLPYKNFSLSYWLILKN